MLFQAETIIKHALALAPNHPDILTEYGILIETVRKNVVEAEELYTRALSHNPHHKEASMLVTRCCFEFFSRFVDSAKVLFGFLLFLFLRFFFAL